MLASCASEDHAKSMDGDQGRWATPEENRWLTEAYQNCFERVYGRYEALEAESICSCYVNDYLRLYHKLEEFYEESEYTTQFPDGMVDALTLPRCEKAVQGRMAKE